MRIQKISLILLILSSLLLPSFAQAQEEDDTLKTLYISAEVVECQGADEPACLLVRENPADNYSVWAEPIDGFTHIEGFAYEITVQVETVESKSTYSLVEIIAIEPTEETLATEFENETVLYVSAEAVACPQDNTATCLLVRENPADNFRLLEDSILGFVYEIGQIYELRVLMLTSEAESEDEEPSIQYMLIEVLSPIPTDDSATSEPTNDDSEDDVSTNATDLTDLDTGNLLDESQALLINELQVEISAPQGFITTDLRQTGAPIYAFAADSTIMENYILRPETVDEFVIIFISITSEQLTTGGIDTSSLDSIIFALAYTDTQLGLTENLIIDGREAVTYPFINTNNQKSGSFTLMQFDDDYLLVQGSANNEVWAESTELYEAVLSSIHQLE